MGFPRSLSAGCGGDAGVSASVAKLEEETGGYLVEWKLLNVCHSLLNWSLSASCYLSPTITALLINILVESVAGSCHCLIISISSLSSRKLGKGCWKGQVADHC